jgi:hypothetical protein
LKIKCVDSRVKRHIVASTSVPFTLTTVEVPNLALTHTKRITVYVRFRHYNILYTIDIYIRRNDRVLQCDYCTVVF